MSTNTDKKFQPTQVSSTCMEHYYRTLIFLVYHSRKLIYFLLARIQYWEELKECSVLMTSDKPEPTLVCSKDSVFYIWRCDFVVASLFSPFDRLAGRKLLLLVSFVPEGGYAICSWIIIRWLKDILRLHVYVLPNQKRMFCIFHRRVINA